MEQSENRNNGIIVSISCNPYTGIYEFREHNSEYIFQELKKEIADSIKQYHTYGKNFKKHIQLTIDIFPIQKNQINLFQQTT